MCTTLIVIKISGMFWLFVFLTFLFFTPPGLCTYMRLWHVSNSQAIIKIQTAIEWITFHSCHRRMAHNALIFHAYFLLKQHYVHEQAGLCHPWMSTSLLSHQFPLPETLNHQAPVPLCELAFYSRVSQTRSGPSRTLICFVSPSLCFPLLHVVTPAQPSPTLLSFFALANVISLFSLSPSLYCLSFFFYP